MRGHLFGLALSAGLLATWPINGHAQATVTEGELFLGVSKLWGTAAFSGIVCSPGNCAAVTTPTIRTPYHNNGGDASITGNFNRFAGIEMDVSCCQKLTSGIHWERYTFLFGPHFAYQGNPHVSPFLHVLLGLTNGRQATPDAHSTWRPGFTTALGGGLDVKAARFLWIRVIQADYLRQSFRDDLQNNGKLSFGVVFRFGSLAGPGKN